MEPYLVELQPSRILNGIPLSDGRAEGCLRHSRGTPLRTSRARVTILSSQVFAEIGKMRQAVQVVSFVLENSIYQVAARLGKSYAEMFGALREMLHDPLILGTMQEQIEKDHLDAGSAVEETFGLFRTRLINSTSAYLKERATDLLELQSSLMDALSSINDPAAHPEAAFAVQQFQAGAIVIIDVLTPRLILDLNNTNIRGIVCEHAGPTSHAAILCRAFQIPTIAGIGNIFQQIPDGWYAILDGSNGTIEIAAQHHLLSKNTCATLHSSHGYVKGIDLSNISLMANLNFSHNAIHALTSGAQGIGLYRTEFEFMIDNRLLTKKEQFLRYRNVVTAMMGLPVTIRLMDIAIDKTPSFFEKADPSMNEFKLEEKVRDSDGESSLEIHVDEACCGALFLLSRPDVLGNQACAIAEAAQYGPVRVLYPMVADARQFIVLKKLFLRMAGSSESLGLLHGAMIELPSAVEDVAAIVDIADFICLGTNDLIKNLLHVDRQTAIAHDANVTRSPLLWDAIGRVASAAAKCGKEVTVCGEMASDMHLFPQFTEYGIKTFSMDLHMIRRIRKESLVHMSSK